MGEVVAGEESVEDWGADCSTCLEFVVSWGDIRMLGMSRRAHRLLIAAACTYAHESDTLDLVVLVSHC